jgi:CheY-like chemotaxis protein
MVCDDDPMVAAVATALLRGEGFEVTTVASATELTPACA